MANIKFKDFAISAIANVGGISSGATSLTVTAGHGALFPTIASPQYFYVTLVSSGGDREEVKVTARSTDTFTIARAQGDTTAYAFAQGSAVVFRWCKPAIDDIVALIESGVEDVIPSTTVMLFGQNSAPTGWTRKTNWQDGCQILFSASGNIEAGGSYSPKSEHRHSMAGHTHGPGTLRLAIGYRNSTGHFFSYDANGAPLALSYVVSGNLTTSPSPPSKFDYAMNIGYIFYTSGGGGNTATNATTNTAAQAAPYYQEVIAATKDAY